MDYINYKLDEVEASDLVAFIKSHEREDIPDDVWDLCMNLMEFFEME